MSFESIYGKLCICFRFADLIVETRLVEAASASEIYPKTYYGDTNLQFSSTRHLTMFFLRNVSNIIQFCRLASIRFRNKMWKNNLVKRQQSFQYRK